VTTSEELPPSITVERAAEVVGISRSTARRAATLDELPLLLTVDETARVLRIGRNGAYAAVADGSLPAIRIGRTIRVPREALAALLSSPSPELVR